jgi:hypothetical protein
VHLLHGMKLAAAFVFGRWRFSVRVSLWLASDAVVWERTGQDKEAPIVV